MESKDADVQEVACGALANIAANSGACMHGVLLRAASAPPQPLASTARFRALCRLRLPPW